MADKFIVIGLGEFGLAVCNKLSDLNMEVLAIDKDSEKVQSIQTKVTSAVTLDATDEVSLKAVGGGNFDTAIVSVGDDLEASVLVVLHLKKLGVKCVIVKAASSLQDKVLGMIGADKIILPEVDAGRRLASSLVNPISIDFSELPQDIGYAEFRVPKAFYNKTIAELDIRRKYSLNIIGIKNEKGAFDLAFSPEHKLSDSEHLMVIGNKTSIKKFQEKEKTS